MAGTRASDSPLRETFRLRHEVPMGLPRDGIRRGRVDLATPSLVQDSPENLVKGRFEPFRLPQDDQSESIIGRMGVEKGGGILRNGIFRLPDGGLGRPGQKGDRSRFGELCLVVLPGIDPHIPGLPDCKGDRMGGSRTPSGFVQFHVDQLQEFLGTNQGVGRFKDQPAIEHEGKGPGDIGEDLYVIPFSE